jgi:leucine dehydrogenase
MHPTEKSATRQKLLFERFGEFVHRLGGNYITAKDVGMSSEYLKMIKFKTPYVLGIEGESGSSGDPSPATAWGVYFGMRACAKFALGAHSLKGLKIALQGLGAVSYHLLGHLTAEGAIIIGCDVNPAAISRVIKNYPIEIVSPEKIYDVDCDIFAPCALGGTIQLETLSRIRAKVIAGPANNQLASPLEGAQLFKKNIIYAPDYVINGGGLINIYYEHQGQGSFDQKAALNHVRQIETTVAEILERSKEKSIPTDQVADQMAEERIQKAVQGKV